MTLPYPLHFSEILISAISKRFTVYTIKPFILMSGSILTTSHRRPSCHKTIISSDLIFDGCTRLVVKTRPKLMMKTERNLHPIVHRLLENWYGQHVTGHPYLYLRSLGRYSCVWMTRPMTEMGINAFHFDRRSQDGKQNTLSVRNPHLPEYVYYSAASFHKICTAYYCTRSCAFCRTPRHWWSDDRHVCKLSHHNWI